MRRRPGHRLGVIFEVPETAIAHSAKQTANTPLSVVDRQPVDVISIFLDDDVGSSANSARVSLLHEKRVVLRLRNTVPLEAHVAPPARLAKPTSLCHLGLRQRFLAFRARMAFFAHSP